MTAHSLASILRFVLAERGWDCPASLEHLARQLPAVASAGLEVPLGAQGTIDLQQRIRGPAETGRLVRWLARMPEPGEPWRRLRDALGRTGAEVEEFWLELDDRMDDAPLSVFVRIAAIPAAAAGTTIDRLVDAFGVRLPAARGAALARCLTACPSGARVSHLGLMLGRVGAPIRLIIEGVPPNDMAGFLGRCGWGGAIDGIEAWTDRLFVHADRIRLAITLADALAPDIGLECFVGDPGPTDPRWRCLLDWLVEQGLCTASRREQLLAWPAALTPVSAKNWPEALLVDALLQGAQAVRWLDCRLSHVKVSLTAGLAPSAKGYFGFVDVQDEASGKPAAQPRGVSGGVAGAIEAASAFLLASRNQAGWWLDYEGFSEGPADEWVTAYVAHALHIGAGVDAADAARRAWHLLARRARSGWGWNYLQPADADSTIWGLRLAADLGMEAGEEGRAALAFLRDHVQPDGGVATYRSDIYRGWSDGAQVNAGWYGAHPCVTAAAAQLPSVAPASLDYLRRAQRADGVWQGYWWKGDAYTTALAAEALAASGDPADAMRVVRAAEAVAAAFDRADDGGPGERPFDTALALRTLLLAPQVAPDRVERARDLLLGSQRADGSWTGSAVLSIPNKRGELVPAVDNRRCFTTATVLTALLKAEAAKA